MISMADALRPGSSPYGKVSTRSCQKLPTHLRVDMSWTSLPRDRRFTESDGLIYHFHVDVLMLDCGSNEEFPWHSVRSDPD